MVRTRYARDVDQATLRRRLREFEWALARSRSRARGTNVRFGAMVKLSRGARLSTGNAAGELIEIGDDCKISHGAILATYGGWIRLGSNTTVNPYTVIYGHGGTAIGHDVRIATHVVIIPGNHIYNDPCAPIFAQGDTREGIVVEDDVWIGAHATILDGCTVGRGSIIAAGAVVTHDVPPLAVVAGCPARVINHRGPAGSKRERERPTSTASGPAAPDHDR